MLYFHPSLFMQNMGLATGHCGQAHVKKSGACIYNFWSAPENWLLWDLSTREGRLVSKQTCSAILYI